jgi:hypothetical protein
MSSYQFCPLNISRLHQFLRWWRLLQRRWTTKHSNNLLAGGSQKMHDCARFWYLNEKFDADIDQQDLEMRDWCVHCCRCVVQGIWCKRCWRWTSVYQALEFKRSMQNHEFITHWRQCNLCKNRNPSKELVPLEDCCGQQPQLDCMIVSSCGGTMEEPLQPQFPALQTQLLRLYSFPQTWRRGIDAAHYR